MTNLRDLLTNYLLRSPHQPPSLLQQPWPSCFSSLQSPSCSRLVSKPTITSPQPHLASVPYPRSHHSTAMSSSIAIPKPKKNKQTATSSSSYSPASSAGASYQYGVSAGTSSASSPSSSTPSQHPHSYFTRRPSMLSELGPPVEIPAQKALEGAWRHDRGEVVGRRKLIAVD